MDDKKTGFKTQYRSTYRILDVCHQIIECDESQLSLKVCEFTEMSSCMRSFRAEALLYTINVAKCRQNCFQIQLATLRKIRSFFIILESKEG
jgi:hypothetical protein